MILHVYSDDNSNNLVFRIRIMKFKKESSQNDLNIVESFAQNMRDKIIIKGIDGINSVSMYKIRIIIMLKEIIIQKDEWVRICWY